jgi:hypothetical protein
MSQFSANTFWVISSGIRCFAETADRLEKDHHGEPFAPQAMADLFLLLRQLQGECTKVELRQSHRAIERLITRIKSEPTLQVIHHGMDDLAHTVFGELEDQLFLWIPNHRSGWYGKKAEDIAGVEWCSRFPSTVPEIEEAAKCYAVGRYTASVFHLMRATESATKALGRALGMTPAHPGWKLVFDEVYAQYKNKRPRHAAWLTHENQLVQVSGDLRTISHIWRNDVAHFVDTYSEDNAREMFTIVPVFMRNISMMIDEAGKLY